MLDISALKDVVFFAGLPDEELRALASSLEPRRFDQGAIIFDQGSPGGAMYIIESGQVRIFVYGELGQEMTVNVYGAGDVFGELALLDDLPRSAGAMAIESTQTLILHRNDLLRHLQAYPAMALRIIEVLSTRLRYTTVYLESLAFLTIQDRVAARLLDLADRYGTGADHCEIGLQLTQAELASWVGATRESVNKALGHLRDQGLIQLTGKQIVILDRAALRPRGPE
ncbi:MAG: Crp/Fnr family transcriptional regulator [Chloroflexi bacterium]|nr:Crp/Fnr family transcriptional regulator [Chloroflexota bacterium]MBU1749595.1 Crp/Fnr family transcriptional regulator [Chloroflexota bacterium]MBU1879602.1 Crp/Fnr family transcriptional regulator [Chloroflexota bacterium]